ncbi:phage antirepressor N-terminal domain-containing protein [Nocardia grenadensis]|uniref:phage antirepressor N-terminal domain-containing protein n=1 Tax=Nocardia grenadensis TaxID=931537 RepID=UPI000A4AE5C9|nr:phage antirepressor N-terminal domain-containing protein [Nocardia grenadensis]
MEMTDNTLMPVAAPGSDQPIMAMKINGEPWVALKPMCEALGVDPEGQRKKLKEKAWATTVMSSAVAADGKGREMTLIDRRTMTMWLATIDENRVKEESRPVVRAFQTEAADALDKYFHEGGAINPRATEDQLRGIASVAQARMELLAAARGLIDDNWLETKARHVLAQGLSEEPEINPAQRHLTISGYLEDRGIKGKAERTIRSSFGKLVKAEFVKQHGREPGRAVRLIDGTEREVFAYTEADRPIMDAAFAVLRSSLEGAE